MPKLLPSAFALSLLFSPAAAAAATISATLAAPAIVEVGEVFAFQLSFTRTDNVNPELFSSYFQLDSFVTFNTGDDNPVSTIVPYGSSWNGYLWAYDTAGTYTPTFTVVTHFWEYPHCDSLYPPSNPYCTPDMYVSRRYTEATASGSINVTAVPAPVVGAGLPGLIAMALFGLLRKRKNLPGGIVRALA